jgi:hypothetical protein
MAGFLFLSLDEATMVHEKIGGWLERHTPLHLGGLPNSGFWWLFCLPPFLAFMAIWLRLTARYWRPHPLPCGRFALGLAVFLASAVGLELASNLTTEGSGPYYLTVLLEELGEMVAATVLLWATWELLVANGLRVRFEPGEPQDL